MAPAPSGAQSRCAAVLNGGHFQHQTAIADSEMVATNLDNRVLHRWITERSRSRDVTRMV